MAPKKLSAAERKEIEAWVKDEVAKGRPTFVVFQRARERYGALDWKTLMALILQILSSLFK